MPDAHANFAYSLVATAPSPATSGTSLVVTAGQGTRFPDPATVGPYNCTIWATGALPTPANAEIVRVTAKSTDTLTITRAQEGSSARTVVVGDQIAIAITAKTLTDIEAHLPRVIRKTANETVNNSATLQNDDHLLTPLAANEEGYFKVFVSYTSNVTPDLKIAFTVPSGATVHWIHVSRTTALVTTIDFKSGSATSDTFGGADAARLGLIIEGVVLNGATPGNLQMQWAQAVQNASDTIIYEGSVMLYWPAA